MKDEFKIGELWGERDSRFRDRRLVVVALTKTHAIMENPSLGNRRTRIKRDNVHRYYLAAGTEPAPRRAGR